MLIQSQSQQSGHQISESLVDLKLNADKESATPAAAPQTGEGVAGGRETPIKEEMTDAEVVNSCQALDVARNDDKSDVDSISIDPRTYCKLGHFHLLLEEYPKGK